MEIAQQAIDTAHVEAVSAVNGQDVEELRKVGVTIPTTISDSDKTLLKEIKHVFFLIPNPCTTIFHVRITRCFTR